MIYPYMWWRLELGCGHHREYRRGAATLYGYGYQHTCADTCAVALNDLSRPLSHPINAHRSVTFGFPVYSIPFPRSSCPVP